MSEQAAAERAYETGVRTYESGDFDLAVAHLVTVPVGTSYYRSACVFVAQACARRRRLGFDADQFVGPFRRSDPTTPDELTALYLLGRLYEEEGFVEEACEALRHVVRVDASHADAAARLESLSTSDAMDFAEAIGQDLAFWSAPRAAAEPELDDTEQVATVPTKLDTTTTPKERAAAGMGPGVVIAERYRIESEIGRGGMGVVYRAHDVELNETVAIKTVDRRATHPELLARLKQELAVSRKIGHPNVVRVYDMGLHEGSLFITMELLDGVELKKLVGHVDLAQALELVGQLADGLAAVHGLGVVHRDVKTANVFVTDHGVVKLMDFGLAKIQDAGEGITVSGFAAGTPGYMPPEQVMSFGSVTPAADLYALGAVLYEVVTGTRPFRHKDPAQIVRLQLLEGPKPMRSLRPELPQRLDALALSLLAPNAEERPPSAKHVRAELDAIRSTLALS